MKRMFVAIDLPEVVVPSLRTLQTGIQGLRWTPAEQLHLTLKFLGDCPTTQEKELRSALGTIDLGSFILSPEGVGKFPPRGQPAVIWVGMGTAHPHLFALAEQINELAFQCGLESDRRIYQPHITLARCREVSPEQIRQWLKKHQEFAGPPFKVDEFRLYSSILGSSGVVHSLEQSYPLT